MTVINYPKWFSDCLVSNEEALKATVHSEMTIGTGFATSEPHTFIETIWPFIQQEDLHDIRFMQALFMAPHKLLVGDALDGNGLLDGVAEKVSSISFISNIARAANNITKKIEGLNKLVAHYEELQERRIEFTPAFIGAVNNILIPNNPLTRLLHSEYVGRNTTRMGVTDMHSVHFPDAVGSMAISADGESKVDLFALVMTPPDENGDMSHGPANGANGEVLEFFFENPGVDVVLYVNPNYPFTRGYGDAANTVNIEQFKKLADAGRLYVVEDDAKVPAMPPGSFASPAEAELAIADHVVNHIETNKDYTYGLPIQVGIGGTGVLAIRALKESSWHGRSYTEMLEPFTLDLFDAGKIAGSHFIQKDGTRKMLDGKMVCTFTICEEDSDFYQRIDNNPNVVISTASRVVIPEAFYGGMGINNILGIDFHGHVNSGGRDKNHHSGIGGGAVIVRGLARGGVAYLCLKSTHRDLDGKLRSSVFPFMPTGTPISHVGPDIMGGREGARIFLVTEHGVAQVSGCSQWQFIKNIISVADPQFRDWLKYEAYKEFRVRV